MVWTHKQIVIWNQFFHTFSVVSQDYATRVNDFDVILGNSALLKCEIPSFVTDFVSVINWSDAEGQEFFPYQNNIGDENLEIMGLTQAICFYFSCISRILNQSQWCLCDHWQFCLGKMWNSKFCSWFCISSFLDHKSRRWILWSKFW